MWEPKVKGRARKAFSDVKSSLAMFFRGDSGATSTVLAIGFPAIIGAFVLIIEVGFWHTSKVDFQATVDMAAIAGAKQYVIEVDNDEIAKAVIADANGNRFDPTAGDIQIHVPPVDGAFAGKAAVQVKVTQDLPTFFVHMFRSEPITAEVSAVVAILTDSKEACVVTLAETGTGISFGGNVDVALRGCVLHANSSSNNAIKQFGSAELIAGCTSSVGTTTVTNNHEFTDCNAPIEGQEPIADPFAHVNVPANVSAMPCNSASTTGKGNKKKTIMPNAAGGVIRMCGDVDIYGETTLQAGTYIIDGGELDLRSKAELLGTDVTLIFMNNAELGQINNSNVVNLSAPSAGDYAGMVMFTDRDSMNTDDWKINGQADVSLTGAVYLPTVDLDFVGGAGLNSTGCTQLVVNKTDFKGNSAFEADCDSYGLEPIVVSGSALDVQLVE